VYNVPEALRELMFLARWIPTSDDFSMDLLNPIYVATGSKTATTAAWVVLSFEGCTPSTQIGQIYVSTCMSFKPQSVLGSLYETRVRGAYEGTHRLLHYLRKKKVFVNFDNYSQLRRYIVNNYA